MRIFKFKYWNARQIRQKSTPSTKTRKKIKHFIITSTHLHTQAHQVRKHAKHVSTQARKHAKHVSTQAHKHVKHMSTQARKHAKHASTQARKYAKHAKHASTQARQTRSLADSIYL